MKNHARRGVILFFTALWTIAMLALPCTASETKLETRVPENITLEIELSGSGKVLVNGNSISKSTSISVPRQSLLQLEFKPARGKIALVALDGEDISDQIENGVVKIQLPGLNSRLCIRFVSTKSDNPPTGDGALLCPIGGCLVSLAALAMMCVSSRRRPVNKNKWRNYS